MRAPSPTQVALLLIGLHSLAQQQDIRRLTTLALLQRKELNFVRSELQSHSALLGVAPPAPPVPERPALRSVPG